MLMTEKQYFIRAHFYSLFLNAIFQNQKNTTEEDHGL